MLSLISTFVFVFVFVFVIVIVFVFVIVFVVLLERSCFLITLITSFKGANSLGMLYGSVFSKVSSS